MSKSVAIAPQTTTRNRRAVVRMSTDFCDANGSRLSTGTNTTDRKIDPPIQLTAASTWNQTKQDHHRRSQSIDEPTLFMTVGRESAE